jgi:multicomponent Na+:H+ antiporter subunit A
MWCNYIMFIVTGSVLLRIVGFSITGTLLFSVNSADLCRSVFWDRVGVGFRLVVLVITARVVCYSLFYIDDESNSHRFMLLLVVFVLSMLALINRGTVSTLILGWDGLGLSSYFLVAHYPNIKGKDSRLVTVLSNRVGDVFIVLFIILAVCEVSSSLFWKESSDYCGSRILGSLLLLGAITKSAIFPYCSWLPEAIAAPNLLEVAQIYR